MKTKIALIAGIFIGLCAMSVSLSSSYFSSGMSTQTAHVLTSLRALHDWGFFELRGVSVLIPRSQELEGLDFGRFTMEFNEAIYLSYPSGWLVLPYTAYVIVHAIVPTVEIGQPFLLIYNIVVDRLVTAVLLLFFLIVFLPQLFGKHLSFIQCGFLTLIGCAFWLLSPPVLYWTQNAYGMDSAVIPFVVALLLFAAWKECRISACTGPQRILLFVLVFLVCFVDWYGWVAAGVTIAACLGTELLVRRPSWRCLLISYSIPLLAVACVGGLFLFQLMSFPDGFHQLVYKYGIRSAHSSETVGMIMKLGRWWREYLPTPWSAFLVPVSGILTTVLIRQSPKKIPVIAMFIALFLPPFLWTILLPEHSAVHEFSLLKFAIPTAVLFVTIAAFFTVLLRDRFPIRDSWMAGLILLGTLVFAFTIIRHHQYKPIVYQDDVWADQIAVLMNTSVGPDDIPLADADMLVGSRPPHKLWYADRWIYPPFVLHRQILRGFASAQKLTTMHPVYLRPEGSPISAGIERLCRDLWQNTGVEILGANIFLCRTDTLRTVFYPELFP